MSQQTSTPTPDAQPTGRQAWGHGLATVAEDGTVLDVWYPFPELGRSPQSGSYGVPAELASLEDSDPHRRVKQRVVTTEIDLDTAPADTADAYLRLHLLSHRLVRPREVVLDGIFGVLANVVWTNHGPCAVADFERVRLALRANVGPVTVYGIDKFPRMTDYVTPTGVRIADADRVRLGAHLATGTTVMHEGFVNFNAGTLGTSMVEGRISAGVLIGEGSDVGGGASIMGTLSGGGKEVVSIGERTLLGANSGTGIALGDDCIVEAGTYITAGTKVTLLDERGQVVRTLPARGLSGSSGLLFRRNSVSGTVEALQRKGTTVELNSALHAN